MSRTKPTIVRFGTFEADLRRGELRNGGALVPLQEKPFRVLELLLARPGEIVTREELCDRLWPAGTFVDFEAGLNTAVKKVRAALDDSAEKPTFIETVDRRGYRFIAPISASGQTPFRHRFGRLAIAGIAAALMITAVHSFRLLEGPPKRAPLRSLAVLPLTPDDASPESAQLADALTDRLIASVSRGPSPLRVVSRESAMRYRGQPVRPASVGAELRADALVLGRLSRSGKRIRIALQLIESRTGDRLWVSTYDSDLEHLHEMQETMSAQILRQAGVQVASHVASAPRSHGRAYLLYLRGRYEWNKVPPNYAEAMVFFQRAIDEDSRLAVAYAGLADCYATRRFWGRTPPSERSEEVRRAKELARRALEIDATLGEAFATLGSVADDEYDFATADAAFSRAVRLSPSVPHVHGWYALHLARLGRFDQAITEARTAVELDPVSWFPRYFLGEVLSMAGRDDEALRVLNEQAALYPDRQPHMTLFFVRHRLGDDDGAIDHLSRLSWLSETSRMAVATAYRDSGFTAAVTVVIEEMAGAGSDLFTLARLNATAGNTEGAVSALQRSYERGETRFGYVNVCPELASVRKDPRVASMIRAIHLQ